MTKFANAQKTLQSEIRQFPELRHPYLKAISEAREGRTVVSFFMSFYTRTPLMPEDADQIEKEVAVNEGTVDSDALNRIGAFPVKGGDIVPVRRKSWFRTVEQKQQPSKQA